MDNSGDYISRDDGKVAAWEILEGMGYSITHNDRLVEEVDAVFDDIPAADVRSVVLCRDCKWTKTDEMDDPAIYCMQWDRWETPPDGFCWLGEKREES